MEELNDENRFETFLRSRAGGFSGCDVTATVFLPAPRAPNGDLIDPNVKDVALKLASIQTISYSVYSNKNPIRALGFKNPINYGRGGRTIAGTLIFNQIHQHPFDDSGIGSYIDDQKGILSYSSGSVRYVRPSYFGLQEKDTLFSLTGTLLSLAGDVFPSPSDDLLNDLSSTLDRTLIRKRHAWDFSWDQRLMGQILHPSDMPPFDIVLMYVNEFGNIGKVIIYGVELLHESSTVSINDIYTEVVYQYVARDIEYFTAASWEQTLNWRSRVIPYVPPVVLDERASVLNKMFEE